MYRVSRVYLALVIVLLVCLQSTIANQLRLWGAFPDLTLICVIFCGANCDRRIAAEAGVFAALCKSAFSLEPFPLTVFLYVLCALAVNALRERLFSERTITQVLLAFCAVWVTYSFYYLGRISSMEGVPLSYGAVARVVILPSALATTIVTPAVFGLLNRGVRRIV